MPLDRDTVIATFIVFNAGVGFLFLSYQGGKWAYNAISGDTPEQTAENEGKKNQHFHTGGDADPAPSLHKIFKKESESDNHGEDIPQDDDPQLSPGPEEPERNDQKDEKERDGEDESYADENDIMMRRITDAVLKRLTKKLERGEITLGQSCACESATGGKNVMTHVTQVTNVTRLQYQCLLDDKVRWGMLENDLKSTIAEEMDSRLMRAQKETGNKMAALNHTMEGKLAEIYMTVVREEKERRAELDQRLREMYSRLELDLHLVDLQGFLKIDTVGPVLLVMGTLEILLMMCMCLLFVRQR